MTERAVPDFEKLGVFYLGRRWDPESASPTGETYLYDSKDLTTHAVCVGMTGSGKTGLCLSLLEEAALDGIPAIAIDPKGDLGNLLLTFPRLEAADFEPWVDPAEATRRGLDAAAYAARVAKTWSEGLAAWGQDGARIARLRAAADFAIYTPGSTAGLPLRLLRSFAPPAHGAGEVGGAASGAFGREALAERIEGTVAGLLALLDVPADPLKSPEPILLAKILEHHWTAGHGLDLPSLIREIQTPPFDTVGVFDLESFLPRAARLELAMRCNHLLASPSFAAWLEGEPLEVSRLLHDPQGRPRIAIVSLAHLAEGERMFFVTTLLNEVLGWVRSQSGTSSLRAILYMDEIFGYFPPTAAPPSKKPMLTLLKQARASGLGVVLATQNPADLDYKGLANTGTWFLGRLQTERDKMRVLEGLEGAAAATGTVFEARRMDQVLSSLPGRVFLAHNVHEDAPLLFHTRWAMSYLRGPLTRDQIARLMGGRVTAATVAPAAAASRAAERSAALEGGRRPILPPEVEERFLAPARPAGDRARLVYRPTLHARARLHYLRSAARSPVDHWEELYLTAALLDTAGPPAWEDLGSAGADLAFAPAPGQHGGGAQFQPVPAAALRAETWEDWRKRLAGDLYRDRRLVLYACRKVDARSQPGESEGDFRSRCAHLARERRDRAVEELRNRFAPRLAALEEKVRRAEEKVQQEESQLGRQRLDTVISIGATLAGALLGRKLGSVGNVTRTRSTLRGFGRAAREKEDVARAGRGLEAAREDLARLESDLEQDVSQIEAGLDPAALELDRTELAPRKSDVAVESLVLLWTPWRVDGTGIAEPLFELPAANA